MPPNTITTPQHYCSETQTLHEIKEWMRNIDKKLFVGNGELSIKEMSRRGFDMAGACLDKIEEIEKAKLELELKNAVAAEKHAQAELMKMEQEVRQKEIERRSTLKWRVVIACVGILAVVSPHGDRLMNLVLGLLKIIH